MQSPSIFEYIKSEENNYETQQITVGDNWQWNMRDHIQLIFHLKHGKFYTGPNGFERAFKQIMQPILDLAYWTEDIDVKDTVFFVENDDDKVKSFLIKKYHDEVYVRENNLENLYDGITESDLDYGGVVVQKGVKIPEVLPLNSIAFCDQTNIMAGPIGIKTTMSPDRLRMMSKKGWGSEANGATISIEDLIVLADNSKEAIGTLSKEKNQVTGKAIEIYIVKGELPKHYLYDDNDMETTVKQVQIVAFYVDKDSRKQGVCLYRKEDQEETVKFYSSKEVYQRALGYGVGEQITGPQVWTNFLTIHKMNAIEASSKILLQIEEGGISARNNLNDADNLELITTQEGKPIRQVPNAGSVNIQLLSNAVNEWYENSQLLGQAFDPILGKEASSGTTFRGQERTVAQGRGSHDRRRGKRAKFIEEIYRDFIIPDIKKEIVKDQKFLATLTNDELQWVAERISIIESNKKIKELILSGKDVTPEQQETIKEVYRQKVLSKGNQQMIEILKDELSDIEMRIGINIAGKQKDLAILSDKLLSIFQSIIANPGAFQQALQIPSLSKAFNDILEYSNISPASFASLTAPAPKPSPLQPINGTPVDPKLQLTQSQPNE